MTGEHPLSFTPFHVRVVLKIEKVELSPGANVSTIPGGDSRVIVCIPCIGEFSIYLKNKNTLV